MKKGFTLVEVMIVVAIIGLLAAIAVPAYNRARTRSYITRAESDLRIISGAVEELAFDTGQWPGGTALADVGDEEVLDLNSGLAGIVANDGTFSSKWDGPYMKAVPQDPWGMDYFFDPDYQVDSAMRMVVGSYGPNKAGLNNYDSDDIYVILN